MVEMVADMGELQGRTTPVTNCLMGWLPAAGMHADNLSRRDPAEGLLVGQEGGSSMPTWPIRVPPTCSSPIMTVNSPLRLMNSLVPSMGSTIQQYW